MNLEYLGHSAFKLEHSGFVMILDPYQKDSVPGLSPIKDKANQVVCSHKHGDHYGFREIKILVNRADTPFIVNPLATYHDEEQGALRGENVISVIDVYDHKYVHMGDIGCIPSDEQIDVIKNCDLLMIPVGGFYTLNLDKVVELIEMVNPKIVVPMHYRGESFGYDVLGTVDDFLAAMAGKKYIVNKYGSCLEITDTLGPQIAVMTPKYS